MARVGVLVGDGYEDSEFEIPRDCLANAGHDVIVLGVATGALAHGKRGASRARVDQAAGDCHPEDFDALVIPGGHAPDHLRLDPDVVGFVRAFVNSGRPVAAICHGPQLLIEADVVRGRRLTSWPSVRTDLVNAGARWEDAEVVEDGHLITSRKPDDLDAFCRALLQRI